MEVCHGIEGSPVFDLRVFCVRFGKCEIDHSIPGSLILNHMQSHHHEAIGVPRKDSMLQRRDRLDIKCEEAAFVSTEGLEVSGSLKFIIEVCLAGSFMGNPIFLTKTIELISLWKDQVGGAEGFRHKPSSSLEVTEHSKFEAEGEACKSMYMKEELLESKMSWFSAGVRIGVGMSLGICLGVGIGLDLLVRTYRGATGVFRRRQL